MTSLEAKRIKSSCNGELGEGVTYLPLEIVFEILLRLPIDSLIEYKVVCKSWYNIIKDSQFIDLHLKKSIYQRHLSYLLFHSHRSNWKKDSKVMHSIYSVVEEEEYKWRAINIVDNLFDKYQVEVERYFCISGSCNGLLCISPYIDWPDPVFICNLITRECMKLPATMELVTTFCSSIQKKVVISKSDPLFVVSYQQIGFGYDPLSRKYKLVRMFTIVFDEDLCTVGEIMTMGEESWRRLELPHTLALSNQKQTLVFKGSFYWFIDKYDVVDPSDHDDILVLDIATEKFSTIKFPPSVDIDFLELESFCILMNHRDLLTMVEGEWWNMNLRIWQLMDNCWTCQYMNKGVPLQCMEINDKLLLQDSYGAPFFLYDTIKRQVFKLEVSEGPGSFAVDVSSFVPSLVSPRAIINAFSH